MTKSRRARVTFEGDVVETSTAYWWHGSGIDFCPDNPAVTVEWLDDEPPALEAS